MSTEFMFEPKMGGYEKYIRTMFDKLGLTINEDFEHVEQIPSSNKPIDPSSTREYWKLACNNKIDYTDSPVSELKFVNLKPILMSYVLNDQNCNVIGLSDYLTRVTLAADNKRLTYQEQQFIASVFTGLGRNKLLKTNYRYTSGLFREVEYSFVDALVEAVGISQFADYKSNIGRKEAYFKFYNNIVDEPSSKGSKIKNRATILKIQSLFKIIGYLLPNHLDCNFISASTKHTVGQDSMCDKTDVEVPM